MVFLGVAILTPAGCMAVALAELSMASQLLQQAIPTKNGCVKQHEMNGLTGTNPHNDTKNHYDLTILQIILKDDAKNDIKRSSGQIITASGRERNP